MHFHWMFVGILIAWIAAWIFGCTRNAAGRKPWPGAAGPTRELDRYRRIRYHAFRAAVSLVLIGVIVTIRVMTEMV